MSTDDFFTPENYSLHQAFDYIMRRVYFENEITPEIIQQALNQTYSSNQPYTESMFLTDLMIYLEYWTNLLNAYVDAYISDQIREME